ncbi:NAD(P)/FAD-dependent oxidoreductase [Salipiger sp. IMCC34102]|uniref:NAD(P)/FAD-dependent oxidoreductase n=1 Tax=Salipiger sp. IMCC34102 TaxID=2510647 RepID=UPI00101DF954|nr:NAD(P)/FAD-dependent oxidoreductase [Salipiger sp. IMCC34102]RYH00730.1 NAD(P)/FAD-dependent oxidoreductase [Salipiger sp. IMCC34102]
MGYDVIIIGGSFAGLSAAMQLARARRDVLILDTSTPRNRYAVKSHGFPGQDGQKPAAIAATLRAELSAYATVQIRGAEAKAASQQGDGFVVSLSNGEEITTRRLVLAYGVRDTLPDLPGLRERWGASVLHCPYCHGYELNRQPMGVLARNELAMHQAMLLPDWGPTTLFTQGTFEPTHDQRQTLAKRGAIVEEVPIIGLVGPAPVLEAVRLADGREVPLAGLFIAPQTAPSNDLGAMLGCETKNGPTGPYLAVDGMQATSVPGVFAAGDLASPMPNATLAAAAGVLAGGAAHRSLIFDPDLTEAA